MMAPDAGDFFTPLTIDAPKDRCAIRTTMRLTRIAWPG